MQTMAHRLGFSSRFKTKSNTLNTGSSICTLQRVPHNNTLDNGHGCLCPLHLGNIIWGDGTATVWLSYIKVMLLIE